MAMKEEDVKFYPHYHGGEKFLPAMVLMIILALGGFYVIGTQLQKVNQNIYLNSEPKTNDIFVNGEAKTKIAPDQVQIAFTIETNDSTSAKISQEKNAEISSRVIAKLKEAGLTDQDIKTTSFSVQLIYADKYTCPDALDDCDYYDRIYASELVGYKTTHEYLIKYGETPKAGDLVDRLSIGGNELTVDSIQFALKPETRDEIERQLLADAGKDARNKAERIASGLGASLGRLTSASENIDTSYGSSRLALSFMAEDVGAESYSTEVFASDIEVVATISATFEIQ